MNIKDVENLVELARIDLTEEEKQGLLKDFDSILAYVKQIESVNTREIKSENKLYNIWREDIENKKEFSEKLIKDQFSASQDGFVKVKKIL